MLANIQVRCNERDPQETLSGTYGANVGSIVLWGSKKDEINKKNHRVR
jgi:hypothetical protein